MNEYELLGRLEIQKQIAYHNKDMDAHHKILLQMIELVKKIKEMNNEKK
jgi:hypothetical protein